LRPQECGLEEKTLEIAAPAKLNLYLEVLGRREDGYHELESVFHAVSIFDSVRVSVGAGEGIEVSCSLPGLGGRSNLAFRAAGEFLSETGLSGRVSVEIEKVIPAGAGLGGGSSDAAAVLVALERLFGTDLGPEGLRRLAARVGSDCPFFVEGGSAAVRGRGERVEHFEAGGKLHFVVVYPGFEVSTEEVYKNLTLKLTQKRGNAKVFRDLLSEGELASARKHIFNRLEETALALEGRLREKRQEMERLLGGARMTLCGSGSSFFSAFADEDRAVAAYEALEAAEAGAVFLCESTLRRGFSEHPKGDSGANL